jgi:metallo-beta-lactamase family protein
VSASLTFLGAAGTVTGSKFLLEAGPARILLECGMFQGLRELRERNWAPLSVDPATLQAVLLSHAHIDHSGYLSRLARDGFRGPVYCSPGTADLLRIMLPDAAHLNEEEAEHRNRVGATRFQPALPLFTVEDAERALGLVKPVAFDTPFTPARGVEARLSPSGHILGASVVQVTVAGHRLVYSGDLGRYGVPIMRDPDPVREADTLLVESTYGNRLHPDDDGTAVLVQAVERAVQRRGWLLVPAFAIGRAQQLLYLLRELEEAGRIPKVPVYLDSPMAIQATVVYALHPDEHDADANRIAAAGRRPFVPARFHLAQTVADSKRLNEVDGPLILIAGSGMATGGRILHHLERRLPESRTTVLFAGYQAAGTRGRLLVDGARALRIFGKDVPVGATILRTDALSAHADRDEILRWLEGFGRAPAMTYAVHGEPEAAQALVAAISERFRWPCRAARDGERVEL